MHIERRDIAAAENPHKVEAALKRFRVEDVRELLSFDVGYRLLDAQFGPVNEIERREVLERWFAAGSLSPPDARIRAWYYMMLLRDADGRVAAVRDGFSAVDRGNGRVVCLLSHSLVLPEWRRSGAGALLRAAPVAYARREGGSQAEITLVSEMEPLTPRDPLTLARMLAYAHGGFQILPPDRVAYAQPDFRDVDALGIPPKPIPFLLLVRQVGEEDRTTMAPERVVAILDHLGALHAPSVAPVQIPWIRANALRNVGTDPVPLIEPPRSAEDRSTIERLSEPQVLPFYPAEWQPEPR